MFAIVLAASALLLHLTIAVILVRKYIRTRDIAFIWLGVAVVIWPLVSRLLEAGERILVSRTLNHQWDGFYPFTLLKNGRTTVGSLIMSLSLIDQLVGVCLLLIAVFYLSKTTTNGLHPTR
jgi:hypothetical protein